MSSKRRIACDRCYTLKEKCISSGSNPTLACSRCARLDTRCTTLRQRNKLGRRRKTETASTQPQAGAEFVWTGSPVQKQGQNAEPTPTISSSHSKTTPGTNTKSTSSQDETRPKPNCTHTRKAWTPIRPALTLTRTPTSPFLLATGSTPLTQRETLLLQDYLTNRQKIACFLLSASSADAVLSHLCTTLHSAPETLLPILLACAKRSAQLLHPPAVVVGGRVEGRVEGVDGEWRRGGREQGDQDRRRGEGWARVATASRLGGDVPALSVGGKGRRRDGIGGGGGWVAGLRDEGEWSDLAREMLVGVDTSRAGGCYSHSAKAVMALRGMEIGVDGERLGSRQVVLALTLGLGLVTFDLLDSGRWAHEICRFTLGLVERGYDTGCSGEGKGWVYQTGSVPEVDAWMVPLVFMDVVNCIVRRQVPVCRLEIGMEAGQYVDKYLGVCGELLAPLFDLCRLGQDLRVLETRSRDHTETARATILGELGDIENTVLRWNPRALEGFALTSTLIEARAVEIQAKVFRAATLLTIHRLRYGFGTRDVEAKQLSQAILIEINKLYPRTSPSGGRAEENNPSFYYRLSFPFFVAALEVQDSEERMFILDILPIIVCEKMYPEVSNRLRQALSLSWEARDWGCYTSYIDLVSTSLIPLALF